MGVSYLSFPPFLPLSDWGWEGGRNRHRARTPPSLLPSSTASSEEKVGLHPRGGVGGNEGGSVGRGREGGAFSSP